MRGEKRCTSTWQKEEQKNRHGHSKVYDRSMQI